MFLTPSSCFGTNLLEQFRWAKAAEDEQLGPNISSISEVPRYTLPHLPYMLYVYLLAPVSHTSSFDFMKGDSSPTIYFPNAAPVQTNNSFHAFKVLVSSNAFCCSGRDVLPFLMPAQRVTKNVCEPNWACNSDSYI